MPERPGAPALVCLPGAHDRLSSFAFTASSRLLECPELFPVLEILRRLRLRHRALWVASSPLFASDWYRKRYPDVNDSGMDPALHYVACGGAEGRWPHPVFDPACFGRNLRQAMPAGRTPLEQYLSVSPGKRPSPHPLFDPEWYRTRNPNAPASGADALVHFITIGGRDGFSPHPEFDSGWYLARYRDVEQVGVNPLVHFLNAGAEEGRDPNPRFSTCCYVKNYPDVAAARINALVHYVVSGKDEGRVADTSCAVYQDNENPLASISSGQVRIWTRRSQSRLSECLRQRPWPLIDWKNRLVVSWSAKSACTHVLIWHLDRLGLLNEASAQSSWPHDYRVRTYYSLPEYQRALDSIEQGGPGDWTYVKVVRDPCNRCISSYRHALAHGYADRLMTHFLGRPISHLEGFAYADFLEYLRRIDLQRCDIHHRLQRHPLDPAPFGKKIMINIDQQDLDASLSRIGCTHESNSCKTDAKREKLVRLAALRHATENGGSPEDPDFWLKPLTREDIGHWPKSELQGCLAGRELARGLYARDYAMFEWFGAQCENAEPHRHPTTA